MLAGLGGVFLLIGLAMIAFGRRGRHRGVPTTGTIVGYGMPAGRGGFTAGTSNGPVECPIVEFETLGGQPIRGMARNGSSPRPGRVGAPITVHYLPHRPERFTAQTKVTRRVTGCLAVACVLGGGLVLALGLVVL